MKIGAEYIKLPPNLGLLLNVPRNLGAEGSG
jgi:hypothetical protein